MREERGRLQELDTRRWRLGALLAALGHPDDGRLASLAQAQQNPGLKP